MGPVGVPRGNDGLFWQTVRGVLKILQEKIENFFPKKSYFLIPLDIYNKRVTFGTSVIPSPRPIRN